MAVNFQRVQSENHLKCYVNELWKRNFSYLALSHQKFKRVRLDKQHKNVFVPDDIN